MPVEWFTSWVRHKAKRKRWFDKAKRWKPRQIAEHNAAIAAAGDEDLADDPFVMSSAALAATSQVNLPHSRSIR